MIAHSRALQCSVKTWGFFSITDETVGCSVESESSDYFTCAPVKAQLESLSYDLD